jgi:hypothetical protein
MAHPGVNLQQTSYPATLQSQHTHEHEDQMNWMTKTGVLTELIQHSEGLCRQQKTMCCAGVHLMSKTRAPTEKTPPLLTRPPVEGATRANRETTRSPDGGAISEQEHNGGASGETETLAPWKASKNRRADGKPEQEIGRRQETEAGDALRGKQDPGARQLVRGEIESTNSAVT